IAAARGGAVVARPAPRLFAVAPVRDATSGRVVATVEVAAHRRFGPPALLGPLAIVALLLGVGAVVTRPLARRLSRPLERLTEAARRLGGGDLAELERLIDDLLVTTRLEATGLPTRLGEVVVRALLTALAERARHDPAIAGRVVEVGQAEPVVLVADEALLRRALWNLVENA